MKKLLVLMLVLGIGAVASAGPIVALPVVDGIVTWDQVGSQLIGTGSSVAKYEAYITLPGYAAPFTTIVPDPTTDGSNAGVMADAGNAANILQFGGMSYNVVADQVIAEGVPASQFVGEWFRFDIPTEGDVVIWTSGWAEVATIHVTPEPMTMALLGLGGLFLRRRK